MPTKEIAAVWNKNSGSGHYRFVGLATDGSFGWLEDVDAQKSQVVISNSWYTPDLIYKTWGIDKDALAEVAFGGEGPPARWYTPWKTVFEPMPGRPSVCVWTPKREGVSTNFTDYIASVVPRTEVQQENIKKCICPDHIWMSEGCKCGAIEPYKWSLK